MQKAHFLVKIQRIELVDIRKCIVIVLLNKRLLSNNTSEFLKNTYLSPVSHQISVSEFVAITVAQEN